jgi:hypothetical protein
VLPKKKKLETTKIGHIHSLKGETDQTSYDNAVLNGVIPLTAGLS